MNMKMIKISAIIAIFTLILSMFTACGGDVAPNSTDTDTDPVTEAPTTEVSAPEPVDPLLAEIVQHMKDDPNYVIFVVGDSITEGVGASDPVRLDYTAKFTEKLAAHMPDKNVYRVDGAPRGDYLAVVYPNFARYVPVQRVSGEGKITVVRCGVGGDTVQKIINRSTDFIGKEIDGETGDLFIIMAGCNDFDAGSYDLSKYASPPAYKKNLNTLLDMIYAEHPDADVILMTPTTIGNDGKALDVYAKQMFDIGASRNIPVIDQHKLWMDHWVKGAENFGQGDWLSGDSCHPSDIGHEAIADYMIRCLFGVDPNN